LLAGCARQRQESDAVRSSSPAQLVAATGNENMAIHQLTESDSQVLTNVALRALPAVVSVASTRVPEATSNTPQLPEDLLRRFFGPEGSPAPFSLPGEAPVQHGLGSGVLVAKDVVLTNAHVVAGAKDIVVTASDKRVLQASVAGVDAKSDLAVLRITSDTNGLAPLEFADSSAIQLGQIVLAIGYPFGLGGTVTMGIVSAKGRADLGIVDYEDFLQTDAAINPGNSGGALINLRGQLVGVPTAILSRSGGNMGVGFAIPSNMARPIMTSLLEQGHVTRGFLGVSIQGLDRDLAQALDISSTDGVLIGDVSPGSPAEKGGLKRGDVVLAVDGKKISTTGEFRNLIAAAGAKAVELALIRDGKRQSVRVELGVAPRDQPPTARAPTPSADTGPAGLRLAPLDVRIRQRLELPSSISDGAVVTGVERGSPAAEAGLQPGDVILEVDREPVRQPQSFAQIWNRTKKKSVPLLVWRDQRTFFAVLER
jgi:serine protease Do